VDQWRTILDDSVRYWERKRIVYNLVLITLVAVCWGPEIWETPSDPSLLGLLVVLLIFAGIANSLYCLAYPIDFLLQLTPVRATWLSLRWLLFTLGLLIASLLALWVMLRDGMA